MRGRREPPRGLGEADKEYEPTEDELRQAREYIDSGAGWEQLEAERKQLVAETDRITHAVDEAHAELLRAIAKFPSFNSAHEGKAVIEEELDELWGLVKENKGRSPEARAEATQVAAMAIRFMLDLTEQPPDEDPDATVS